MRFQPKNLIKIIEKTNEIILAKYHLIFPKILQFLSIWFVLEYLVHLYIFKQSDQNFGYTLFKVFDTKFNSIINGTLITPTQNFELTELISKISLVLILSFLIKIIILPFFISLINDLLLIVNENLVNNKQTKTNFYFIISVYLSYIFMVVLSLFVFIVPGIYLGIRFFPVLFLAIENKDIEDKDLEQIFTKAWFLTSKNLIEVTIVLLVHLIVIGVLIVAQFWLNKLIFLILAFIILVYILINTITLYNQIKDDLL